MKPTKYVVPVTAFAIASPLYAQQQAQQEQVMEEVFVTGSLIRRSSFEGPSAVQQVTAEDIAVEGATNIIDVVRNLSINTGSHLARFSPEFGGGSGATGQFNLRGLGLNATLTLVDGRRVAPAPNPGMGGAQFVNINQIPASMIERVDILKTGASATYGSEAVAGVVNIVTKKNFEGVEMKLDYRDSDTVPWSESTFSFIAGASSDRARATLGFDIQDRDLVYTKDLPIADLLTFRTSFGQPGAFQALSGGGYFQDPECGSSAIGGTGQTLDRNGPGDPTGFCDASLKEFFNALPNDERRNAWANIEFDLADNVTTYAQIGYSEQQTYDTGPTATVQNRFQPIVPGSHPAFPQELIDVLPNGIAEDVRWRGRIILNNADSFVQREAGNWNLAGGGITNRDFTNILTVVGLRGDFETGGGRRWDYDLSYSGSFNDLVTGGRSTSKSREQLAIDACVDPALLSIPGGPPGCFNPFGNAYLPGAAYPNTQDVIDYIIAYDQNYTQTELETVNAVITGGLMDMAAGELSVAFGIQLRDEVYNNDIDAQQNRGDNVNQDNFPEQDIFRSRDVDAYFAELAVPFENVELQLAVRTEDYGDQGGDSTDPKIAFQWDISDTLLMRGSWSTAFRAPSLNQFGSSTVGRTITDPRNGDRALLGITVNTGTLLPEESEATTIGLVWDATDRLNVGFDWWNYDYTDLIANQDPQGLVDAVCDPTGCDPSHPQYNQIIFEQGGRIASVTVLGINAANVQMSGIDIFGSWSPNVGWADSYTMRLDASYIDTYDIQEFEGGPTIDAVGGANLQNIAPSVPQLRYNLMNMFRWGNHSANIAIRFVDELFDDQVNSEAPNLDSRTTIDAQYNYDFDMWGAGGTLSIGAINILDEDIVFSDNETGIVGDRDDPRGRTWYVTYTQMF